MGDPKNLKAAPASLPPGCQFHPTEEQLFRYYLSNKNNFSSLPPTSYTDVSPFGFDIIKEIDLYKYSPFDLPEITCFPSGHGGNKKQWYCFTRMTAHERRKRKARGGIWKINGRARDVVIKKENAVLGTRKAFVFYRVNSSGAVRTDRVMYEYAPIDPQKDSFVLCRVFVKSSAQNKRSEAIHNTGIPVSNNQHDGASATGIGEVEVHDEKNVKINNEMPIFPVKLINEPDNAVDTRPVSDDAVQLPVDFPRHDKLVAWISGITRDSTTLGDVEAEELTTESTVLLDGFIELDDLIEPLSGFGSSGSK